VFIKDKIWNITIHPANYKFISDMVKESINCIPDKYNGYKNRMLIEYLKDFLPES
jgi:hypothetical protein